MNDQNTQQLKEPAQSSLKYIWVTIIVVIATAIITGGGVFAWQKANLHSTQQALQQQISSLQNQVDQLQGELADHYQNNNQQVDESENIENARQTLVEYFDLLNEKQYATAVRYHGSGYNTLRDQNPSIDEDDYAGLLKNGCEMNGLQCLKVSNVLEQQQVSPLEFKFVVQFANNDGSLFKRSPCCGATEEQMPTETNFEFVVELVDNEYLVISQPVYVP